MKCLHDPGVEGEIWTMRISEHNESVLNTEIYTSLMGQNGLGRSQGNKHKSGLQCTGLKGQGSKERGRKYAEG